MRLSILRIRTLAAANLSLLFVMSGMMSMFYFASLYVQQVLGYSPLKAGLAFLPVTVCIGVGAALAQSLIRRFGARAIAVGGLSLAAVGMALLLRTTVHGNYAGQLLVGLIPLALGMGLTFVPITLLATANVHGDDAGLASGLYNTAQQVGGALGLAVLSTLAASRTSSLLSASASSSQHAALLGGFHLAFGVAAGLLALAARAAPRHAAPPPRRHARPRRTAGARLSELTLQRACHANADRVARRPWDHPPAQAAAAPYS